MKIFVLGYNKTGTKSLAKALEILGYNVLHTGGGGEFLEKVGWNLHFTKPILSEVDTYDCYIDYPIFEPIVFSHIIDEYPNAKYISLTRDFNGYVESVLRDKIKRLEDGIENSWNWLGVGDKEVFENYPEYQKRWVREKTMFKHVSNLRWLDKKKIDYLNMNIIDDKDGWEKLCGYLSHSIPEVDFPRVK
jgi:hypothetical protein|tara:strand:- start:3109 stop:3678 length:570 start_codon:yes stop_codon:yes gene_type:complete